MAGKLFLVNWDPAAADEQARWLRSFDIEVDTESADGAEAVKRIRAATPDAVVIDHTKKPSHGRATAAALQSIAATRSIPIIFLGGEGESLEKTKAAIPGAVYASPENLPDLISHFLETAEFVSWSQPRPPR